MRLFKRISGARRPDCTGFLSGLLQLFRLGGLPFFLADLFDCVQMNEGAFFVADHDVERAIAVHIACGDLGADAGIVINLMRDIPTASPLRVSWNQYSTAGALGS